MIFTNKAESLQLSSSAPGEMGGSYPEGSSRGTPVPALFKFKEVPRLLSSALPPPMAPLPCLNETLGTSIDPCCTDAAELQFLQDLEELLSMEPGIHEPGIHADHSGDVFSHEFENIFQHMANQLFHYAVMFAVFLASAKDVIHDESEPAHPHGLNAIHISSADLHPVPSSGFPAAHNRVAHSTFNDFGPGKLYPSQEEMVKKCSKEPQLNRKICQKYGCA